MILVRLIQSETCVGESYLFQLHNSCSKQLGIHLEDQTMKDLDIELSIDYYVNIYC